MTRGHLGLTKTSSPSQRYGEHGLIQQNGTGRGVVSFSSVVAIATSRFSFATTAFSSATQILGSSGQVKSKHDRRPRKIIIDTRNLCCLRPAQDSFVGMSKCSRFFAAPTLSHNYKNFFLKMNRLVPILCAPEQTLCLKSHIYALLRGANPFSYFKNCRPWTPPPYQSPGCAPATAPSLLIQRQPPLGD